MVVHGVWGYGWGRHGGRVDFWEASVRKISFKVLAFNSSFEGSFRSDTFLFIGYTTENSILPYGILGEGWRWRWITMSRL